ncbi:MAG: 2-C-methyl-D-erythritol 4-phosphate cytidylyltransferase [Desulfamplus sp.]|nr:2-C-methyl-D-erythritol 4-phosphate cytidylyltransferase [Desulfamplus sp.]
MFALFFEIVAMMFKSIKNCQIYAVIVAGGKGLRMQSEIRKQYIHISGKPLLAHTIDLFTSFKLISHIILVIPKDDIRYCLENIILPYGFNEKVSMVSGGAERQQSVMNGLKKVKEFTFSNSIQHYSDINSSYAYMNSQANNTEEIEANIEFDRIQQKIPNIVLIHDGVRPFADHDIINRCIKGALKYGACIPVVPVSDTLKKKGNDGFVEKIIDRENLYKVQTPQAFDLDLIIEAHQNAMSSAFSATDDASLLERMGKKVFMTQGAESNIKITTQEDLLFAEYMASITAKK